MPHEDRAGVRVVVEDHAPVADAQAVLLAACETADVERAILGDEAVERREDASANGRVEPSQFLLALRVKRSARGSLTRPGGRTRA
jgi:hypothetical protein